MRTWGKTLPGDITKELADICISGFNGTSEGHFDVADVMRLRRAGLEAQKEGGECITFPSL